MKLKKTTIILIIGCILGLSLLLYPSVSNYWNMQHATQAINKYVEHLNEIGENNIKEQWLFAVDYNKMLTERENNFVLTGSQKAVYDSILNVSGDGLMGYIDIEKLGVSLPIYHGTSDAVLQRGVGHLEWSSLPIGGESTHSVLSGHRGLPNMRLFTDLDRLREGDTFTINILNTTVTYEVDLIRTVEPDQVQTLQIEEGNDLCTLVTCTPYGINTHRLLVRGHRIENLISGARVVSEAVVIDPLIVAPIGAFPFLFVLLMIILFKKPANKKKVFQPTNEKISQFPDNSTNDGGSSI